MIVDAADMPAGSPSRWRAIWRVLLRIEEAMSAPPEALRDRRIAALEAEMGVVRRMRSSDREPATIAPQAAGQRGDG